MTTETINLEPTVTPEPQAPVQDINAPIEPMDVRLNFNCMLYLFTELVALLNELVLTMKNNGQLSDEDIKNIYEITANQESLTKVYQPVFNRFMEYYVSTKKKLTGKEPVVVSSDFDARDENSATEVSSTVTAETTVVQEEVEENS